MPSLRSLIRPKDGNGKKDREKERTKLPILPKSPKSPDLSKTEQNQDYLNQCRGCNHVEDLIVRSDGQSKKFPAVLLHQSFKELSACSQKCDICRVFRQALLLQEVTFDGAKGLWNESGEVMVSWESKTEDDVQKFSLRVELKGQPSHFGIVSCGQKNKIEHLALSPDALDSVVIQQAKRWLNTCVNEHIGECDNFKWSSENPRLLVEILSPESVRLRENQEGEYVALSYCWGNMKALPKAEQDEIERGKTVLANLDRRRQPFSMDELPRTVRDALRMIHAMGLKYGWIDTLCIVQDKPEGVPTMHIVYSNALFTLCSCATTKATAKMLDKREAWNYKTEPCKLWNKWLTTPDMSLSQLRLKSPLADRAWTLQEERLSPRMLYVSSSRVHWSCSKTHTMELQPTYGHGTNTSHRPSFAIQDGEVKMPPAQKFLMACYDGAPDIHTYWADIIKSYAFRNMSFLADRLTALSGLAAKYLSASSGDEYLAGIWAKDLAEGLAWKVNQALEVDTESAVALSKWPSWSWAVVPVQTVIETNSGSAPSSFFQRIADGSPKQAELGLGADEVIKRGQEVKEIHVIGRTRPFWGSASRPIDWSSVSKGKDGEDKFTFAFNPQQDMHSVQPEKGRVLVYEGRKKPVVGQLDFRADVERMQSGQLELHALELGTSTMLLLEPDGQGSWRRVGIAWDVRQDYFASTEQQPFILR